MAIGIWTKFSELGGQKLAPKLLGNACRFLDIEIAVKTKEHYICFLRITSEKFWSWLAPTIASKTGPGCCSTNGSIERIPIADLYLLPDRDQLG
jgi:hypothetical protein